jgi:tRNA (mo5U34)-methyltransferase
VYDLSPDRLGTFDLVVCGSLLLHLRDPMRALEAVRSVCSGEFLSAETIDVLTTVTHPRRPVLRLLGEQGQWMIPNAAGHRHMLDVAGFDVVQTTKPYSIPSGPAHPHPTPDIRARARFALQKIVTGGIGVPMAAVLAKRV